MITEDFVSYEVAQLLKEKGMNKSCFKHYVQKNNNDGTSEAVTVCTLQMAMKWLRKMGLHIFVSLEVDYDEDERGDKWYHDAAYYPEIRRVSDGQIMYDDGSLYASPEQAMEIAIKFCLENLI